MRKIQITLPELALVAGTRGMLGVGIGLLLADRLPQAQRKAVGWTLATIGLLTTIPLAIEVFGEIQPAERPRPLEPSRDEAHAYAG
jgi:uncharacterized membrane protein YfcA